MPMKCPDCGENIVLDFPLHDCRPPEEQIGAPRWFKESVPRGSLAASKLAQAIKELRRRKVKPFYYEAKKQQETERNKRRRAA